MRGLLTVLLVVLCLSATGCFVFDELDGGQDANHSSTGSKNQAGAGAKKSNPSAEDGFSMAALREKGVGALEGLSGRVEEAMKKAPDPANVMVRCSLEGHIAFTRKFDCQSRGGRVVSR